MVPPVSAVPRELQAEVECDVTSQSQDVAERDEVRDFVPLVDNLRSLYHEKSKSLGERIRPRARKAGGDRGEKDDVRIVPSPPQIDIHVRVRAEEHLLEREKRAFRAVKLRGLFRSREGGLLKSDRGDFYQATGFAREEPRRARRARSRARTSRMSSAVAVRFEPSSPSSRRETRRVMTGAKSIMHRSTDRARTELAPVQRPNPGGAGSRAWRSATPGQDPAPAQTSCTRAWPLRVIARVFKPRRPPTCAL